jgi:uncharacterized protein (TIGR03435 family)
VYVLVVGKNGPKLKASTRAWNNSRNISGTKCSGLDNTGLRGFYDFTLNWTPDFGGPPPPDSSGVDIFKAIQEQLGLKLEPQRRPLRSW